MARAGTVSLRMGPEGVLVADAPSRTMWHVSAVLFEACRSSDISTETAAALVEYKRACWLADSAACCWDSCLLFGGSEQSRGGSKHSSAIVVFITRQLMHQSRSCSRSAQQTGAKLVKRLHALLHAFAARRSLPCQARASWMLQAAAMHSVVDFWQACTQGCLCWMLLAGAVWRAASWQSGRGCLLQRCCGRRCCSRQQQSTRCCRRQGL